MQNPGILNALANPAKLELPDPMDQYGKMLQMQNYLEQGDVARQKRQSVNAMRQVYKDSVNPDGSYNEGKIRFGAAQAGVGENIPDIDEWFNKNKKATSEVKEIAAKTEKTFIETVAKTLENSSRMLAGVDAKDPQVGLPQFAQHVFSDSRDPVYVEIAKRQKTTPEAARDQLLKEAIQAAESGQWGTFVMKQQGLGKEALQKVYNVIKTEKDQKLVAAPVYGPGAPEVAATYDPAPKAAGTSVTVTNPGPKAANSFGDTYGQESAKQFVAVENANRSALNSYPRVDRALQVLNDGVTAGALSGQITDARALAKQFGFAVDDKRLINTQELRQMLLGFVFDNVSQLKASGVSLTPMTDHDIQMLKDSIAKGTDDVETIRRYLLKYRESLQNINQQYHDMAKQYGRSPVGPALRAVPADSPGSIPNRPPAGTGEAPDDLLRRLKVQ